MNTLLSALVITYYNAPNYGAFLQAYAMQQFLRSKGIEAKIKRHRANNPNLFTFLKDKRTDKAVLEYRNEIQSVIDDAQSRLHFDEKDNCIYDVAIIGSDEVWNVKNMTANHLPLFFRPYKSARQTVSYAPCSGRCAVKHLKLFPYTAGIRKLNHVSVRDDHTEQLMKDFGVKDVQRVLDPTFLHDFHEDLLPINQHEKYLFVYTYGFSADDTQQIIQYARNRNLKIIATGSKCDWADENPMLTPFEWISYIKNSQAVITSTFHGTIFSIIFNKEFVTLANYSNKISSLLDEFSLQDRFSVDGSLLEDKFGKNIDYDRINRIKTEKIAVSEKFLLSSFQEVQNNHVS